tara:strand:- start:3023 stop:3436 length:414 start_codon:yes stop_codon:yes gene_type:complete
MSESEIIEDTLTDKQPTEDELQDFKNKMAEWLKMDEQINKLSIAIRERRRLQNALSGYIKDFMFKFNYNDVSINNAKVKARQRETLVPLKVNDIKAKLLEYKNLKGEELVNMIFDNREKKVVNTVKRVIPKINHLEL